MKAAYKNDWEAILEIFRFWHERGFTENKEIVLYFMKYISYTQDINPDHLKRILEKSEISGGDLMPTLAQRFREEFKEEVREEVKEEVIETLGPQLREEGEKEGMEKKAKEAALRMLKKGFELDTIIDITGLKKSEIEKLASRSSI
jgi:hypothetical protein